MTVYTDDLSMGLKAGMRRLAASVCILSLQDKQGERHAMTATAVTSLSDNPPALLVCVNKAAAAYEPLLRGAGFCINVLGQGQEALSALCASQTEAGRFSQGNWQAHPHGQPFLVDAQASFFCTNEQTIEYGSHIIAIGKLTEVRTSDGNVEPLLYADGQYHRLA